MIDVPRKVADHVPGFGWWFWFGLVGFECPNGHRSRFSIPAAHKVAMDGSVTPSAQCPDCAFHEHVRLLDWPGCLPPERTGGDDDTH